MAQPQPACGGGPPPYYPQPAPAPAQPQYYPPPSQPQYYPPPPQQPTFSMPSMPVQQTSVVNQMQAPTPVVVNVPQVQAAPKPVTIVQTANPSQCPECKRGVLVLTVHPVALILAVVMYFCFLGPFSLLFLLCKTMSCPVCGYCQG